MKKNPLLVGVIGFLLGGLLVSIAAYTFEKDTIIERQNTNHSQSNH